MDARRAVDDPHRSPRGIAVDPAIGKLHDQRSVACAITPTIALELYRTVRDDSADLRRDEGPETGGDGLGFTDHRVGVDPVRAGCESALAPIVAQTPCEEAGVVAAAPSSNDAVRSARRRVVTTGPHHVASPTHEGTRPDHGLERWWQLGRSHPAERTTPGCGIEQLTTWSSQAALPQAALPQAAKLAQAATGSVPETCR